ncbi:MAG: hypothetical protein UIH41_03835, partial [Treponemataceae bacterium]|nr:hypothetical protein [Treponemataceae bacterium]
MKILDHTKPLSGIKTRLHKKILWPCYEYNLVIKGRVNLEDNILESLILQLMEANVRDLDQLSSMTGLERDLIIFLRERLHHKGYLDDLMHITEFGLKKINKRSVPEQYYCSIFVDAISGKLLPKIIPLEEQKEIVFESAHELSPEETNDTISYFSYKEPSSVGYEDIESKLLPLFSPQKDKNREPSSDDIRDLIKKVFTGKECNYITFNLACDYKLTYLTVDLVLQEGNKFLWITTDGFGDISPFFSENLRYLNQNEEKYIQGLRKKLSNKIIRDAGFDSKNNCSSGKEDKDWIKYPEIGNKLQKLQGLLKKLDKLGESSDEQRILHEAKITSIENIYQIIEWILYYYIKQNELYAKKQIEEIQNLSDKPVKHTAVGTYVVRIARDLGFQISKEQEKLFRTKLGTMKFSMKAGENHELFSLLNLTIAINKDVQESPVRKLAVEFPTLLAFLGELKEARGKAAHSHETNISATKILEYFTNLEKIINILFKKKISEANTPNKKLHRFELVQEENIENEIISLLEEKYGYGVLYVLP